MFGLFCYFSYQSAKQVILLRYTDKGESVEVLNPVKSNVMNENEFMEACTQY